MKLFSFRGEKCNLIPTIPMWTRFTFVMLRVWPGIDEASQAPLDIVFSSCRTHSTEGWGNPFAAQRSRKWSPSRTTTDRGLSEPYSAALEMMEELIEVTERKMVSENSLAIDGGISISFANVPLTLTFHKLMPGIPCDPSLPGFPVRPRGPVRPTNWTGKSTYSRSIQ